AIGPYGLDVYITDHPGDFTGTGSILSVQEIFFNVDLELDDKDMLLIDFGGVKFMANLRHFISRGYLFSNDLRFKYEEPHLAGITDSFTITYRKITNEPFMTEIMLVPKPASGSRYRREIYILDADSVYVSIDEQQEDLLLDIKWRDGEWTKGYRLKFPRPFLKSRLKPYDPTDS
ncbi:MAG: hypothetical protein IIA17_11590, partial [candidate division Zixibacteria bacterium]|nr:hypothetical protein [candidate division Zixibacteria bacterium]